MNVALVMGATALAVQSLQAGVTRTAVFDNATVGVARIRLNQGAAYNVRADTAPVLIVSLPRGDVQMIRSGMTRTMTNAEARPLDLIAVTIKPTRPPAQSAPPTPPPTGISRTTLLDTADVRIVRAKFAPDGREPVHTHPNDLLTIQLSSGRVEIMNGADTTTAIREPGFVQFLMRDVPHAYASADTGSFELLSIAIK